MNATVLAVGVLALGVTAVVALGAFAVRKWLQPALDLVVGRYVDDPIRLLHERLKTLENDVDELPRKWQEIERDSKKLRDRATYHVRRVRAELDQLDLADPELDALASDLRGRDGEPGEQGELLPVPAAVAEVTPAQEDPIMAALRHKWAKHGL